MLTLRENYGARYSAQSNYDLVVVPESISRREFLKRCGALTVSFSAGPLSALSALSQGPFGTHPSHRSREVDSWLAAGADGVIADYTGKCDFGRGFLLLNPSSSRGDVCSDSHSRFLRPIPKPGSCGLYFTLCAIVNNSKIRHGYKLVPRSWMLKELTRSLKDKLLRVSLVDDDNTELGTVRGIGQTTIGELTDIMRIIKRLFLLCLLTSALAQVQTAGTVTLTGSVQLMVGAKHSVSLAWKGPQGQYITFRIYRSTTNGAGYQMIQSLISGLDYTDGDVAASTYYYVATTYDSGTNSESSYSNQITVNLPN